MLQSVQREATTRTAVGMFHRLFERALQEWLDELYFKSSHYPGVVTGLTVPLHDAILSKLKKKRIEPDSEVDPVSEMLREAWPTVSDNRSLASSAERLEQWERVETTINTRFRIACQLVSPLAFSRILEALVPDWKPIPALEATSTKDLFPRARVDGDVGQPDLMFHSADTTVSLEMKVRGGSAKAQYTADQHFKYLRLGERLREPGMRYRRTLHVLTAPASSPSIVRRHQDWLASVPVDGEALRVQIPGFIECLSPRRRQQALERTESGQLGSLVDGTPSVFIDLRRFAEALRDAEPVHPTWRSALMQQATCCISFGCDT